MQTYTVSMCATNASSTPVTLTDARDGQTYTVRYINGNCWMTRNLAIGCNGSGATYGSNIASKPLSNGLSNVANTSSTPWNTPTLSLDKSDNTTGCTTSDTSGCNSVTVARMKCSSTYGAWYNYPAATAGTIAVDSTSIDATKDICPSGWKLPTNSDFGSITSHSSIFNPIIGGFYGDWNGSVGSTNVGYLWTADHADSSWRYILRMASDGSLSNGRTALRYDGMYVRCIKQS